MKNYVSPDKRSKKAQRAYHAKQRCTWGELNPVTRSVPSSKTYNRKKEKQRVGKEFRNGFDADLLFLKDEDSGTQHRKLPVFDEKLFSVTL